MSVQRVLEVAEDVTTSIPVFGQIDANVTYVDRPGAYALMQDARARLAVVQTTLGFFLPGGGQEPGETLEQTLRRELLEELGYVVRSAAPVARAEQYHWSGHYQQHFKKIGTFYRVEATPLDPYPGCQTEHALIWWTTDEAQRGLSQEFQRWAVSALQLRP